MSKALIGRSVVVLGLVAGGVATMTAESKPDGTRGVKFVVNEAGRRVDVVVDGQPFTSYIWPTTLKKPVLYPIRTSAGTVITRGYPLEPRAGERVDHPHHVGLWLNHGDVNGLDFWAEANGAKQGKIVSYGVVAVGGKSEGKITGMNKWVGPDGTVHLTDKTVITARAVAGGRILDYEVTLTAPADKPVVFGDTKDGSMAMRLPLWMTPPHSYTGADKKKTKHEGLGTIINDSGQTNDATWGKKSEWVDYYAPKDGKVYGIAMFDHPSNPRHPTWWHVRSYALFAANPFGQHDFENLKDQPKAGDMTIPAGKSVTFRWRFYFHMGDEKTAKIAERFKEYAAGK